MVEPPPFPTPLAGYGFTAFLIALLALDDWLAGESIVLKSSVLIVFLGVGVFKWAKDRNTESEISVPDALNLGFAKFSMRFFTAFGVIGTFVFALSFSNDFFLALTSLLLAVFSWYYVYANWAYRKKLESNPRVSR